MSQTPEASSERPKEPVKFANDSWPSDEIYEDAITRDAFLTGARQALLWLRTQTVLMHHSNGYPSPAVSLAAINEECTRVEKAIDR